MRRIQLELRACKDKLAKIPQDFFDNLIVVLCISIVYNNINSDIFISLLYFDIFMVLYFYLFIFLHFYILKFLYF